MSQPKRPPSPFPLWTSAHEARLAHAQEMLDEAQKRWSEEQEGWICEIERLLDLKRKFVKAEKVRSQQLEKSSSLVRRKTDGCVTSTAAVGSPTSNEDATSLHLSAENPVPKSSRFKLPGFLKRGRSQTTSDATPDAVGEMWIEDCAT